MCNVVAACHGLLSQHNYAALLLRTSGASRAFAAGGGGEALRLICKSLASHHVCFVGMVMPKGKIKGQMQHGQCPTRSAVFEVADVRIPVVPHVFITTAR